MYPKKQVNIGHGDEAGVNIGPGDEAGVNIDYSARWPRSMLLFARFSLLTL